MTVVLAIDPGPATSGWVLWDGEKILGGEPDAENEAILRCVQRRECPVVIEWITSYGMAVGKDVFETCYWVGRLDVAGDAERIARWRIKTHLCGSPRAKDPNIRQALIDRFGGVGGRRAAVGTKADPGPLYGCKRHMWAALALAVTWMDQRRGEHA